MEPLSLGAIGALLGGASNLLGGLLNWNLGQKTLDLQKNIALWNLAGQASANEQNIDIIRETNRQNLQLFREQQAIIERQRQQDYERFLENRNYLRSAQLQDMNTLFQREDTAIQRRAQDLEQAGFNKLLSLGNPASSGIVSAHTTQPPTGLAPPTPPTMQAAHVNPYNLQGNIDYTILSRGLTESMNRVAENITKYALFREQVESASLDNILKSLEISKLTARDSEGKTLHDYMLKRARQEVRNLSQDEALKYLDQSMKKVQIAEKPAIVEMKQRLDEAEKKGKIGTKTKIGLKWLLEKADRLFDKGTDKAIDSYRR